ncbi:MAG: GntR family transcriptional regulator [Planctomycetes bacterium]|nr:GntR family transcriptional regulator [Planctomycetota bacterium]
MNLENFVTPLQRKSGIPLYIQIKEGIRKVLESSPTTEEILLPAQRDLAARLGVSRNTVSMAYAELEREQLVSSNVGKGTLVTGPARRLESRHRRERLMKAIEHSVEEALSLGFSVDEYSEAAETFIREKRELLSHIRLVFVECNREQLTYFSEHLMLDAGVTITPVLLSAIHENPEQTLAEIKSADIVVTSFYHVDELEGLLPTDGPPLVGVNLQPEMSTIVRIARIPSNAKIGLLGASKEFIDEMATTLLTMGIDSRRVSQCVSSAPDKMLHFVDSVDAIIVSPSRRRSIETVAADKPLVEFLFAPDKGSVNNLRVALLELRKRRTEERS